MRMGHFRQNAREARSYLLQRLFDDTIENQVHLRDILDYYSEPMRQEQVTLPFPVGWKILIESLDGGARVRR